MSKQSEAKHTPGPHKAAPTGSGWWIITDTDGVEIGSCDGGFSKEEAHLFAASYDLLESLEHSDKQMEMAGDCIEAGRYDEAFLHVRSMSRQRKAAIAKARATHD